MLPTIRLEVCVNFVAEVQLALEAEGLDDVEMSTFRGTCDSREIRLPEPAGPEVVVLRLAGYCARVPSGPAVNTAGLDDCFEMLLGRELAHRIVDSGRHLMTAAMINRSATNAKIWQFTEAQAHEFFGEGSQAHVVIQTEALAPLPEKMAQWREYTGQPVEVLPVSLDYLRAFLRARIQGLRLESVLARQPVDSGDLARRVAEHAMALDMVGRFLDGSMSKGELIERITETLVMCFAPRHYQLLIYEDGRPVLYSDTQATDQAAAVATLESLTGRYGLLDDGFYFQVERFERKLGVVVLSAFERPEYSQRFLHLAWAIMPALAAAIDNMMVIGGLQSIAESVRGEQVTALRKMEAMRAVIDLKEELRRDAEKRIHEKSQFIASAVHDLRQPVQAMINALYPLSLCLNRGDRRAALELVELSQRAVQRLQDQLAAVLDLSRVESDRVRPNLTIVDVVDELKGLAEAWTTEASRQGVLVTLVLPNNAPSALVHTDASFLKRVLSNLVSNGIKYRRIDNPAGCWVRVVLTVADDHVTVAVSDNGKGIAQELIDRGEIFQPFFQANNTLPEGEKGVGLGLAIVKALISRLPDHRLRLTSQLDEGSTFFLKLPVKTDSLPNAAAPRPAAPDKERLKGRHIWLVEDDDLVRITTGLLLRSQEMACDAFASYEEFAAGLEGSFNPPDVVLCDYRLPNGRTAGDVREVMRSRLPNTLLIVISGEEVDLEAMESMRKVPILRKPLSGDALMRAINHTPALEPSSLL